MTLNPLPVTVTDGGTARGDFLLRILPVSLAAHVQPVFNASCTMACHSGASPPDGLNLSAGQSYANTVNVPSAQMPSLDRIEPLQPDNSYLVRKIEGSGIVAGRMPLERARLRQQTIDLIRRWVSEGANNN